MRVHPLALLVTFVLLAAASTFVLPAGQFDRRMDPSTGRQVVVPGSYHQVEASPVGPFAAFVALPKGMGDAAALVFLVFLAGGAFAVVERTGALHAGVEWLADRLASRERLVVPMACLVFGAGGVVEGMWEEIVALTPVLLVLTTRVGFDAVTAVGMSLGAAGVGATFSPMNPFGVGISQRLAELPLMSGWEFRVPVLLVAMAIWIWGTMRHAARHRTAPAQPSVTGPVALGWRHAAVLAAVAVTFPALVVGVLRYDWDLDQMSAAFLVMGVVAGVAGGLGPTVMADAFIDGVRSMAMAALLLGVARAIFVVLDQGRVVDTIVNALVTPLAQFPVSVFAAGISVVQSFLVLPVPSSSGRAALTIPFYVPLSDLLGLSRQVMVSATQYVPGVATQFLPTDGALMAILALARIPYAQWLRFTLPICAALAGLGFAAVWVAVTFGWS